MATSVDPFDIRKKATPLTPATVDPAGAGGGGRTAKPRTPVVPPVTISPPTGPATGDPTPISTLPPLTLAVPQPLDLHRAAPPPLSVTPINVNPGAAAQVAPYQAPSARAAVQPYQGQAIRVPPPPKPPQPPSLSGVGSALDQFAIEGLTTPNRYATPAMQAAIDAINGQIAESRQQGLNSLSELMAQRGLTGSSVEFDQGAGLESQLDQNRLDYLSQLMQNMAAVNAQDRTSAANVALGAGQLGLQNAQFLHDAGMDNAQFAENANLNRANLNLQQQDLDLRAYQIQQDAIQRGQQMDLDQARDQAAAELSRGQLSEQGREFNADLGVTQQQNNQDLALRAYQIQQQAIQNGQQMDLTEAMDLAHRQQDYEQMKINERLAEEQQRYNDLMLQYQALQAMGGNG